MSEFNSSLFPEKTGVNPVNIDGVIKGGGLYVALAEFTVPDGGCAVSDVLNLVDLPQGAVVLPSLSSFVGNGDAGSKFTLKAGETALTGEFAASAASSLAAAAVAGGNFRLPEAAKVTATLSGAALTAGKKCAFVIVYAMLS